MFEMKHDSLTGFEDIREVMNMQFVWSGLVWSGLHKRLSFDRSWLMTLGEVLGMSALFFGMTVLAAEYRFGSLDAGRAWFAGARIYVESPQFRAEYGPEQSEMPLSYIIRNLGEVPIPIVGSSASCSCTVTDGLPVSIPAQGVVEIAGKVRIESGRHGSDIRGNIRIYVGDGVRSEIPLSYVLKPAAKRFAEDSKSVPTGS